MHIREISTLNLFIQILVYRREINILVRLVREPFGIYWVCYAFSANVLLMT